MSGCRGDWWWRGGIVCVFVGSCELEKVDVIID